MLSIIFDALVHLSRREPLGPSDWITLVEARKDALVRVIFQSQSLQPLEDALRRNCYGQFIQVNKEMRVTGDVPSGLKTQGMFYNLTNEWRLYDSGFSAPYGARDKKGPSPSLTGVERLWGLTRQGQWTLIEARFETFTQWNSQERRERWTEVRILKSTLQDIASTGTDLSRIWNELGFAVKHWRDSRKTAFESAEELWQRTYSENILVEAIRDHPKQPVRAEV